MTATIELTFTARRVPLVPRAAVAFGATVGALARRAIANLDEPRAAGGEPPRAVLRGVAGDDVLLLIGDEVALPWVDGVHYLGTADDVPGLYLPCALEANVPEHHLRAVVARAGASLPCALVPTQSGLALIPLDEARPVSRAVLERCVEARK